MSKIMFSRKNNIYPEFSNYHIKRFVYDNILWDSVEAAFQAQKSLDTEIRKQFASLTPGQAKSRGRKVLLRPDWETVKYNLMYKICLEKFKQNEDLKELLLSTGDALLIENTTGWHDNIWGCCTCARCRVANTSKNLLGVTLMRVRAALGGTSVGSFTFSGKKFEIDFAGKEYDELNSTVQGRNTLAIVYRLGE